MRCCTFFSVHQEIFNAWFITESVFSDIFLVNSVHSLESWTAWKFSLYERLFVYVVQRINAHLQWFAITVYGCQRTCIVFIVWVAHIISRTETTVHRYWTWNDAWCFRTSPYWYEKPLVRAHFLYALTSIACLYLPVLLGPDWYQSQAITSSGTSPEHRVVYYTRKRVPVFWDWRGRESSVVYCPEEYQTVYPNFDFNFTRRV